MLADRWVATVMVSQFAQSEVADSVRLSPAWQIHGTAQLSYFFEDSWSLSAGLDHTQYRPVTTISGVAVTPNGYVRQTQIVIGLTYRPVGRFEAPGLGVSERLAPGGI